MSFLMFIKMNEWILNDYKVTEKEKNIKKKSTKDKHVINAATLS